jgi:hypothetical protein
MSNSATCPACGYKVDKAYNISSEISRLLKARKKRTIKYLNKISSTITSRLPFENRINYFRFLFGIQSVEDHVVEWGIEQYYQNGYYIHGKGFAYLRKIIQNRNENIGVLKKNERDMLGMPPPVIEIKE